MDYKNILTKKKLNSPRKKIAGHSYFTEQLENLISLGLNFNSQSVNVHYNY